MKLGYRQSEWTIVWFFYNIILGPYVWNLYKVSIQYLSRSLDQAVLLNSKQLPEIFVYDTFCLVFLFCFTLQICRCLLSFPPVTPVCCTDALMMSDFKTVECFSELRKSNSLHIMALFITQAVAPPECMFLLLNWSTARIAHYGVWELFSLMHPETLSLFWLSEVSRLWNPLESVKMNVLFDLTQTSGGHQEHVCIILWGSQGLLEGWATSRWGEDPPVAFDMILSSFEEVVSLTQGWAP